MILPHLPPVRPRGSASNRPPQVQRRRLPNLDTLCLFHALFTVANPTRSLGDTFQGFRDTRLSSSQQSSAPASAQQCRGAACRTVTRFRTQFRLDVCGNNYVHDVTPGDSPFYPLPGRVCALAAQHPFDSHNQGHSARDISRGRFRCVWVLQRFRLQWNKSRIQHWCVRYRPRDICTATSFRIPRLWAIC